MKLCSSLLAFLLPVNLALPASRAAEPLSFYVNYSARVPAAPLAAHALSIVHPNATVDLAGAHEAGATLLAYLSIGEVAGDAPYRAEVAQRGLPLAGRNPTWNSDLIDLTDSRWVDFLVDELAAAAARRGYDGFFLDTLDSVKLVAPADAARTRTLQAGVVAVVTRLRARFPGKRIVINRGFFAFPELRTVVDGVLVESLYATHDFGTRTYRTVAPAETAALLAELQQVTAAGRAVYVLDYAAPAADPAQAMQVARQIRAHGFHAFVSTPTLDGVMLAPLRPVARRICAFYGNLRSFQAEQVNWPAESFVAQRLQLPLEWLGYEVDYFTITSPAALPALNAEYQAIILPRFLQMAPAMEAPLITWLLAQRAAGRKLIVAGSLPFRDPEQRARFLQAFGLTGTGAAMIRPARLETTTLDPAGFDFEARVPIEPVAAFDLRAPADARRILSLRARPATGSTAEIDPVFTCSWGGMALDPFVTFRRGDSVELWRVNPFTFLQLALGAAPAPAPDTTTRNGRRLLLSHIDGDGFSNFSRVDPGQRAAEIIRDRILKKYPLPVTVSIIEAELRGMIRTQQAGDAAVLEPIAREILALPNVEIASHSFSHPFFWIEGSREQQLYDAQYLDLKDPYAKLDLVREIEGSVRYINERLAPPGRTVRLFQWSGNCRPPPEAIALTRRLGLENMNGGDTLISPRQPTVGAVAPRTMPWDDEVQILAPNQNENIYTNNWRGPLFGTFTQVLDTFALTETPRRLKPVNIYYHFYSGDYPASLHALESIHDWAMAQPLLALTASHYARIARDARATAVFSAGAERWLIVNRGDSRTVRLPAALASRLSLTRSSGVTGWKIEREQAYVHTDGARVTALELTPAPSPPTPRLESASAEITFRSRAAARWAFSVADLRPVTIVIAGLAPGTRVELVANGAKTVVPADTAGRARLSLPARADAQVDFFRN